MKPSSALLSLLCLTLVRCAPAPPAPVPVRVATWNLHDFGAAGPDASRVAELAGPLSPAVIAVQEVSTEEAFNDLISRLPGFAGHLATAGAASGGLRMGLLWDTAKVQLRGAATEPLPVDASLFPRAPLQAVIELTGDGASEAAFVLINVHLKAGTGADDEDRRVRALAVLEGHMRTLVETNVDDEVLLLGDFNEAATDPRFAEAFTPFTSDPALYRPLTLPQAEAGAFTFLPVPLFFDHMVGTAGLDEEVGTEAPEIQRFDQTVEDYREAVSDHLPVVLDLTLNPPRLED